MVTVDSFVALDYVIWVLSGIVFLVGLLVGLYVLPWVKLMRKYPWMRSCCYCMHHDEISLRQTDFQELWLTRFVMQIDIAALAAVQVLRLPLLWGPSSVVAPSYVTSWTSQGWLCRVYLTLNMGVLVPFFCWWILFLLLAAKRKVERSVEVDAEIYTEQKAKIGRMIRKRLADAVLGKSEVILPSLLSSVPIFALQTVTAWIGLAFSYNGNNIEYSPRSVLGYFLGTFWYGTQEQCSTSTVSDYTTCTLCVIPATSVIIHGIWTLLYLALLWHVSLSLGRLVMNRHMRRILVLHACALTLILSAGVACLGSSIAYDPFGWINQGLWLGYFTTLMVSVFLVMYLVVDIPCSIQKDMESNLNMLGTIQPMPPAPVFPVGDLLPSQRSVTFNPIEQVMPVNDASKGDQDPDYHSAEEERFSDAESGYSTPRDSSLRSLRSDSQMSCYYSIRSDTSLPGSPTIRK
eukprot:jgi/Picsp_1/1627/NSC_05104-R2_hypothetical protein CHLNCDRAFT_140060 [Chlorella variabilis]